MNSTIDAQIPAPVPFHIPTSSWLVLLLAILIAARWLLSSGKDTGEPPIVPYRIPWLGHALWFMNDVHGYAAHARKLFPSSPVVSVQVAGRHLYLILDSKLASQIYRKPNLFVFNPFNILVWRVIGATKEDQKIARIGAQLVEDNPTPPGDTRRVLHDSHMMAVNYLSGEPLGEITRRFVEALCEDIDRRFPSTTEWETLDICDYVKTTWTHASTIALFGSNFWSLWPDAGPWLWDFDASFQKIVTQMPRLLFPKPYAIRDEGLKRFVQWEEEARKAEVEGKIEGSDNDDRFWDPFWGHIYARKNMKLMAEAGVSPVCRAGLNIGLFWGLNANAIPVATQVITRALLDPSLLAELRNEIESCQTGPVSFDMNKVTAQPKLRSVFLEALRWATALISPRFVREDCEMAGYKLKKGSMMGIHTRSLQMKEDIWQIAGRPESDPAEFWADRFLEGDEEHEEARVNESAEAEAIYVAESHAHDRVPPKKATIGTDTASSSKKQTERVLSMRPFGGGTSMCTGRHFAKNEILGGLAVLLLWLDVEVIQEDLAKNGTPQPDLMRQGGLFPDRPLMVRVRRRQT